MVLSTYNKRFDHESRMALNALLMGDGYQEKALSDYAVLFKQISWDWFENFYFFPFELKTSLGINTVSMSDSNKTRVSARAIWFLMVKNGLLKRLREKRRFTLAKHRLGLDQSDIPSMSLGPRKI